MLIGYRLIVIANSYFETISYWTEKVGLSIDPLVVVDALVKGGVLYIL